MTSADILLVDDDPGTIQLLARMLAGTGRLRFATNGETALRMARESAPDLMLLDAEMPGMSGFQVCQTLKKDPALADISVMFVTSHSATDFEITGFEIGAVDFIAKPISEPLLLARIKTQLRIKRLTDELRRLSVIDALTEVANRRRFDEALAHEWRRAQRVSEAVALLMVDVDHFKRFNDRHGHPAGDTALRAVARALADACGRPADLVARFGGEEFSVLLPNTPRAGACHMAQRVLDAVAALRITHGDSPTSAHVTVSVGMACFDADSSAWTPPSSDSRFVDDDTLSEISSSSLLHAADKALYAAKHAGRAQAWELDPGDLADADPARLARRITVPAAHKMPTPE